MLVLRFSVHIKLKLKGKCPKHPRFNPELGRGAIRGGCPECMALYEVVAARDRAAAAFAGVRRALDTVQSSPKAARQLKIAFYTR
jgi:hypothetical protein